MKIKLYFQRILRKWSIQFEHITSNWVVPRSEGLMLLIENTNTPDFETYYKRLNSFRQRWKLQDQEFESYAVRGRLLEFKFNNKIDK